MSWRDAADQYYVKLWGQNLNDEMYRDSIHYMDQCLMVLRRVKW